MVITPDYFNGPTYNTDNFNIKIKLFGFAANIKNSLHLSFLGVMKKFFIRSLKKDLLSHSRAIAKLKIEIGSESATFTKEVYYKFEKIINGYIKIYSKLKKSNFFSNGDLKEIVDRTFKDLYSIEYKMKQSVFGNDSPKSYDTHLINHAAKISMKTASEYEYTEV